MKVIFTIVLGKEILALPKRKIRPADAIAHPPYDSTHVTIVVNVVHKIFIPQDHVRASEN